MAAVGIPERDVKEFKFSLAAKVRVAAASNDLQSGRDCLIAVCNKYDLIFVGVSDGIRILRASDVDSTAEKLTKKMPVVEDFPFYATVRLAGPPRHIAVNSDGSVLSVCALESGACIVHLYDVQSFANKNSNPQSFLDVKLGTGEEIVDLVWNPSIDQASMCAICLADGSVRLLEVQNSGLQLLASLPAATRATCFCWSPKGKQIVIGKADGTFAQYDQKLAEKKSVPPPTGLFGMTASNVSVLDIFWESTHGFFVVYRPIDSDGSDQPWLVVVTLSKDGGVSHVVMEDVCYGGGQNVNQKYFMLMVSEWSLLMCSSATSAETAVVGRQQGSTTEWARWSLDDQSRAEVPMTEESYEDTFPKGVGISINSQRSLHISETQTHPPCPMLFLLSSEGLLICYYMIYTVPEAARFNVSAAALTGNCTRTRQLAVGAVLEFRGDQTTVQQPTAKPAPSSAVKAPTTLGTQAAVLPPAPAAAQFPAPVQTTGQSISQRSQPSELGSLLSGGLPSQSAVKQPQAAMPFQFGQNLSGGNGQPLKLAGQQEGTATLKLFGAQPTPAATNQSAQAAAAVASKPFSFGAAGSQPQPFSFGSSAPQTQASGAFPKPSASSQPTNAPSSSSVAAGIGAGTKPLFQSPLAPPSSVQAAQLSAPTGGRPIPSQQQPAASASMASQLTAQNRSTAAAAAAAATNLRPTVASSAGASAPNSAAAANSSALGSFNFGQPINQSTPAHSNVRAQMMSNLLVSKAGGTAVAAAPPASSALPKSSFATNAAPSGSLSTAKPTARTAPATTVPINPRADDAASSGPQKLSTKRRSADSAEKMFMHSIDEEITHFEQELQDMRTRACNMSVLIGTTKEKDELHIRTHQAGEVYQTYQSNFKVLNENISDLKTRCIELFALVSLCEQLKANEGNVALRDLVRSQPLDPVRERQMKTVRSLNAYVGGEIAKVDQMLDDKWQQYQQERSGKRFMKVPATDIIYRTLSDNMKTLKSQKEELDNLYQQQCTRGVRVQWPSPSSDALSEQLSSQLNLSVGPSTPKKIPAEKEAQLREVLSSRKATPVISTIPRNLSASKIISIRDLREMLNSSRTSEGPSTSTETKTFQSAPSSGQQATSSARLEQASPVGMSKPALFAPSRPDTSPQASSLTSILQGSKANEANALFSSIVASRRDKPASAEPVVSSLQFATATTGTGTFAGFGQASAAGVTSGAGKLTGTKPAASAQMPSFATTTKPSSTGATGLQLAWPTPAGKATTATTAAGLTTVKAEPSKPSVISYMPTAKPVSEQQQKPLTGTAVSAAGVGSHGAQISFGQKLVQQPSEARRAPSALFQQSALQQEFEDVSNPDEDYGEGDEDDEYDDEEDEDGDGEYTDDNGSESNVQVQPPPYSSEIRSTAAAPPTGSAAVSSSLVQSQEKSPGAQKFPSVVSAEGFTNTSPVNRGPSVRTSALAAELGKPIGGFTASPVPQQLAGDVAGRARTEDGSKGRQQALASSAGAPQAADAKPLKATVPAAQPVFGGLRSGAAATTGSISSGTPLFGTSSAVGFTAAASEGVASTASVPTMLFGKPVSTASTSPPDVAAVASSGSDTIPRSSPVVGGAPIAASNLAGTVQTAAVSATGRDAENEPASVPAAANASGDPARGPATPTSAAASSSLPAASETAAATAVPTAALATSTGTVFGQASAGVGQPNAAGAANATGLTLFGKPVSTTASALSTAPAAAAAPAAFSFGQPAATPSSASGNPAAASTAATSTASTFGFGQSAVATSSTGLFGASSGSSSSSFGFGQQPSSSTTPSTGLFGQPAVTSSTGTSLFGQPPAASASSGNGLFGKPASSGTSLFGQPAAATSSSVFSQPSFGQQSTSSAGTSLFGQPASTASGVFGQAASTTTPSLFGQSTSNAQSPFGQSTQQTSLFGQPSVSAAGSTGFGFGQSSAFGNNQTPAFGQSTFGQSAGSAPMEGGLFGGGMFGGLGGKPDVAKASANVFGVSFGTPQQQQQSSGLFGQTSASGSVFGSVKTQANISGAFSGGGGSVQSTGFGGFQNQTQPAGQTGGFGSPPAFGSGATFGSPPAFGGGATFGGAPAFGSAFGAAAAGTSPFGNSAFGSSGGSFAALAQQTGGPSFGALAQQSAPTGLFGAQPPQQQQQQQPSFGGFGSPQSPFGGGGGSSSFTSPQDPGEV